ncbi:MAG: type II secretion system F family protein [Acidobacteria bacterium]|nr:type II secretion system F family protein [Acidobacteriota bacterium]MBI3657968.1 type II secretion system F family protein [Acidobacteriota bacterium]
MISLVVVLSFITGFCFVLGALSLAWSIPERGRLKQVRERLEFINSAEARAKDPYLTILRDELLSEIPALHRFLSRFVVVGGLQRVITQANLKIRAGVVLLVCVSLAFGTGYFLSATYTNAVWPVILLGSLLVGFLPIAYVLHLRQRRFRKFEEQLPEALELLGRALRAGHAFTTAIEMIASEMREPISTEFGKAFVQQNFGLPLRQSLMNLTDRVPLLDVQFFVTAVLIQKETGGNLAEILDNLSYVIRERFKLQGQVRAVSAYGRLTGTILAVLPIALAILLYLSSPEYMMVLFRDRTGRMITGVYLVFQVLGFLTIRKIVKIRV